MTSLDRDSRIVAVLAALLAAGALVMLLVHGHAPATAAHVHVGSMESDAVPTSDLAWAAEAAPSQPDGVDDALGVGSWATRDRGGPTVPFVRLTLATVGLAEPVVAALSGQASTSRPGRASRFHGLTPVLRHEVIRV